MEKIRVLLADDHPAFREGLGRLLAEEESIEVVARAADGEEAIRLAGELQPDVVVIDVSMPKVNGIEAAREIKAANPDVSILMVSAFDYEAYVLASIRAGAAGYVSKNKRIGEIVSAIELVHSGESIFDLKAVRKILARVAGEEGVERLGVEKLQRRETGILKLAAKGISNKAIAAELGISERTVQTHMVNIFKKLGVRSRTEAVLCALQQGWLTMDDLP